MPYPHARYYMFAVIAVVIAGFWPSYFSVWTKVPWQFHAHGVAASIWVTIVTAQCWTAHSKKQLELHRMIGKASLFLFPFLIAGLCGIIDYTGKGYVKADDPLRMMFGVSFLVALGVAVAAYVTVYYRALKYRRKVWVHAGYMLSTPLILFESPFSRIMSMVIPAFAINGPADAGHLLPSIEWAMAIELAIIALIWLRYREKANPFLVTAAFIVVEMLALGLLKDWAPARTLLLAIGHAPSAAVVGTGFTIGALTSWAGWQAGKRRAAPPIGGMAVAA